MVGITRSKVFFFWPTFYFQVGFLTFESFHLGDVTCCWPTDSGKHICLIIFGNLDWRPDSLVWVIVVNPLAIAIFHMKSAISAQTSFHRSTLTCSFYALGHSHYPAGSAGSNARGRRGHTERWSEISPTQIWVNLRRVDLHNFIRLHVRYLQFYNDCFMEFPLISVTVLFCHSGRM